MKTVRVYPSPKLADGEYLPGIGADGADLPADEAADLLERGLVVKRKGGWTYADPITATVTKEPPPAAESEA